MEMTMESNGLGRFIESMLPTGVSPLSFGVGGAFAKALSGNSAEGLLQSVVPSAINSVTKAGLTGQQIAENEYTAMREDTRYQRFVEDLEKAGINSAMLLGKSVQPSNASPSASDSGASVAGSFSNLLELASLSAQIKQLHSQADLNEASAAEKRSNVALNDQLFNFNEDINPLKLEAQTVANSIGRSTEKKINAECDRIAEDMKKIAAETETEAMKQLYHYAAAGLADAQATQIVHMLPYSIELTKAQTAAQKSIARLNGLQALYQQHLINDGFLDALISQEVSNAEMLKVKERIKTGRAFMSEEDTKLARVWNGFCEASGLSHGIQVIDYILDKINVFAPLMSKAPTAVKSSLSLSNSELDKYGALR